MLKTYAPLAIYVYNRKDKLERTLKSLEKNVFAENTDVYIFSDAPKKESDIKKVNEVRDYLNKYAETNRAFNSIQLIIRDKNMGLANSIISGTNDIISRKGKVIVVEDDMVCHPNFLKYMNEGLDFYEDDMRYGSITAYTERVPGLKKYDHDIYVSEKAECQGWATWKNRWQGVDWELSDFDDYLRNKKDRRHMQSLQIDLDDMLIRKKHERISSWVVIWCYSLMKRGMWTVYPKDTLTYHIGYDGSGTNCTANDLKLVEEIENRIKNIDKNEFSNVVFEKLEPNRLLQKQVGEGIYSLRYRLKHRLKFAYKLARMKD